jgi:hypothetical protein
MRLHVKAAPLSAANRCGQRFCRPNSCHCVLDQDPLRNVSRSDSVQGKDLPNESIRSQSTRIDNGLSIPQMGSAQNQALYFDLRPFILIL